jgi:DNA-binding MarR family transcriptional regulator
MSTLAELTNASLSRLSHLVKRLEARGLVRREPDPTDGRVRALVIDCLSAEELAQLRAISERLHSGLAPRSD